MATQSFSIAEARHNLAAVVHQLEHQSRIQLTRRGKPVAVLLSLREYDRLTIGTQDFWGMYATFTATVDLPGLAIDPQLFTEGRDRSTGREMNW